VTGIELMSHAPNARLPVPLITPRLQLRPFEPGDVARFSALLSDEDTTRWIGGVRTEAEAMASIVRMRDSFQGRGLGTLAVVPIGETDCAGYCGVRPLVHTQDMELAFGLLKAYWHKGFATEACTACLQATFETFPLSSVVATVYPENLQSIAVLTKLGMKPEARVFGTWPNSFALLFRLTREAWLGRDSTGA
jgi:[ribosomal protein S5]-alanine N-acetyltransferase